MKILAAPVVATVGVFVGVGALAVGCVALPIYGSYKLINHFRANHTNNSNNNKSSIRLRKVSEIADNSLFTIDDNIFHRYNGSMAITSNIVTNDNVNNNSGGLALKELNLIPREASQNQKLINMINNDIGKFNSNLKSERGIGITSNSKSLNVNNVTNENKESQKTVTSSNGQ